MMDNRQRILVGALLILFVAFAFDGCYRGMYEQPLEKANRSLTSLEEKIHQDTLDARRQEKRLPQLDAFRARSLPLNLEVAVTEYRSWLLKAIDDSGLQPPNLDSSTPRSFRNVYRRLDVNVRTKGTLTQLTQFLYQFYETDYLHKIRSLALTPTADGQIDVSLTIEMLSVPSVAARDELPEPPIRQSKVETLEAYHMIAQRNIFREGEPVAAQIVLSAITRDRDRKLQAWLRLQSSNSTRIVSAGDDFVIDGTQLTIKSIDLNEMQIAVDGDPRTIAIGKTLDERN